MATAYEKRDSGSVAYDYKGHTRVVRAFMVDVAHTLVPKDGSIPGLPGIGDPHPYVPGATVDQIEPTQIPGRADRAEVTVYYSTDKSYGFPKSPLDPSLPGFTSWSMSFVPVEQKIPVAKKLIRTAPSPNGGAPTTVAFWGYGDDYQIIIPETRVVFVYRLTLDQFSVPDWGAIAVQNNRLHRLPDTRQYRFEAGDITQTTPTTWEVSYSWWYDSGTFAPFQLNASPATSGLIIYPPGLSGFAMTRFPHRQWTLADPATPTGPPEFVEVRPYTEDDNGYLTLPGLS